MSSLAWILTSLCPYRRRCALISFQAGTATESPSGSYAATAYTIRSAAQSTKKQHAAGSLYSNGSNSWGPSQKMFGISMSRRSSVACGMPGFFPPLRNTINTLTGCGCSTWLRPARGSIRPGGLRIAIARPKSQRWLTRKRSTEDEA